jgi:hypothetical protein
VDTSDIASGDICEVANGTAESRVVEHIMELTGWSLEQVLAMYPGLAPDHPPSGLATGPSQVGGGPSPRRPVPATACPLTRRGSRSRAS